MSVFFCNFSHGSPTPSHGSSQSGARVLSALSGAKPKETPSLTPSLANYHSEQLIGHVSNWPAQNIERTVGLWLTTFPLYYTFTVLIRLIIIPKLRIPWVHTLAHRFHWSLNELDHSSGLMPFKQH